MFTYDLTDEDYELPYNRPGKSSSYFDLDDEVGRGRTKHRADVIKLETILGNSGDMDLDYVGGPTGLGDRTLDEGLRAYQKRNGLEVDGWARPGGPTITKMKEQYGSLLGDYEAPSPRQSDTHHRMRDAGFQGFLKPKRQDLLMPPIPGLPKPDDDILGANHSLVRHVRDQGMQDTAGWMAQRVRAGGDGVVEARNFVEQLDGLMPGKGTKAIRDILQRLADTPDLQRQFFGGPVVEISPVGVFEQDGQQRYEEALKTKPWEEYELGRRPDAGSIRDAAWRRDRDGNQKPPEPLGTHKYETPEEEARRMQPLTEQAGESSETPTSNGSLLDPNNWPEHLRENNQASDKQAPIAQDEEIEGEATATDKDDETAHAIQVAERQRGQPRQPQQPRNPENIDRYFNDLDERVRALAEKWGVDPNYIHALFSMESGWFDDKARGRNNPMGYTVQRNSEAHRAGQTPGAPMQISSLDRAFELWSEKWGPRMREAKNLHDFVENLQLGGSGMYNIENSVHNADRAQINPRTNQRIKSYEEKVEEQYRTVLNRRRLWEQNRQ